MKNVIIAFRSLFKRGRSNMIKIISLSVALAMGFLLIAKVCFVQSYDSFYPDSERIFRLQENIVQGGENNEVKEYQQVSGAVAPGMKAEIPQVELATRLTYRYGDDAKFITPDKKLYSARYVLAADSNVFDIFPRPILAGNPKEALSLGNGIVVSRKISDYFGGASAAIGKELRFEDSKDVAYIIGGVFENVPENATLRYDILTSIKTFGEWSLNNWVGNDRYLGYVKLVPGVNPESLNKPILDMMNRNIDMAELKSHGFEFVYSLIPMGDLYSKTPEMVKMNNLLVFLAFLLMFTAVMNYILIVISNLINRTKEIAVHKCYGASSRNIFGMVFSEALVHVFLSVVIAVFLIFLFRGKIESLFDVSLQSLLSLPTLIILGIICLVIFIITVMVPSYLYLKIPVAAAFRSFKENRRVWKLVLLFVQFAATAFLIMLLFVINRQYTHVVNADPGYKYDRLAYSNVSGMDSTRQVTLLNELSKMPQVEKACAVYTLPFTWASGNNVRLPEKAEELFNIADMYFVTQGYFDLMEIPIIDGEAFPVNASTDKVMISRSFKEKMETVAGWKGSPVGKSVIITEHSQNQNPFTICGVYENIKIGSNENPDPRPSVLFDFKGNCYRMGSLPYILVKLHEMNSDNMMAVTKKFEEIMPDRFIEVKAYKDDMFNLYRDSRNFRDSVMIGGLVTLIIAMIGLLGYISDETNRRSREIAIRKVNGATVNNILHMISTDITFLALPSIIIGLIGAYFVGKEWLSKYADRISLDWWMFACVGIGLYIVILVAIIWRAWGIANENPVNRLKSE